MAQRSLTKRQDPGVWGPSVTGKMEPGETYDETLAREVEEELGLKPSDYSARFFKQISFSHPDGDMREFDVWVASAPKETIERVVIQEGEVEKVEWWPRHEVLGAITKRRSELVPSAPAVWPEVLEQLPDFLKQQ